MAQENLYVFDKNQITGGAGRLIMGEDPSFRPESIEDIMPTSGPQKFQLKEGFRDLGATTEGIAQSRGFDSEDLEIDQSLTPIDSPITAWTTNISTTLMQASMENRQLAMAGAEIKETLPEYGTAVKLVAKVQKGGNVLKVAAVTGFEVGGFLKIAEDSREITSIDTDAMIIRVKKGLSEAADVDAEVKPVTKPGTRSISYGSPAVVPAFQLILISKKDDGSLTMTVYYEVKISGDEVEMSYSKEKRTLPLSFKAFAQPDLPDEENLFKEFEQLV